MVQEALGTDIMMCLDTCIPYPASREEAIKATALTGRWARRSRHGPQPGDRPAPVRHHPGWHVSGSQGQAVAELIDIGFDGYAMGGLSVGRGPKIWMLDLTEHTASLMPKDYPI